MGEPIGHFCIMLKPWILRSWKWVGGVAILGAVIAMGAYQHCAREKYEAKREEGCIALAISPEEKHICAQQAQSRKDYAQWWYVLVTWPEGITTWAIIVTGFFIGWQSHETRKSAEAASKQAQIANSQFVASFRPRVHVRFIKHSVEGDSLEEIDKGAYISMVIVNIGDTSDHIKPWKFAFIQKHRFEGGRIQDRNIYPIEVADAVLAAGQPRHLEFKLPDGLRQYVFGRFNKPLEGEGRTRNVHPIVCGVITYTDDNGCERRTAFFREWDDASKNFKKSDDAEKEYED
jgi:hypothetical protein